MGKKRPKIKLGKGRGALVFKDDEVEAFIPSDKNGIPSTELGGIFGAIAYKLQYDPEFADEMFEFYEDNMFEILGFPEED